jgi:hypothetical protein
LFTWRTLGGNCWHKKVPFFVHHLKTLKPPAASHTGTTQHPYNNSTPTTTTIEDYNSTPTTGTLTNIGAEE